MDVTLRKVDFDKAADEIMARIERDGAIHRSSIVDAMVAVAATVPAVASVAPARGLAAPVVDSEHEAYDKWLAEQQKVGNGRQVSATLGEYVQMAKQAANARLAQSEASGSVGHNPVSKFSIRRRGEWYVSRPLGGDRHEYLHADLVWRGSTTIGGNPTTGYFQTKDLAEAALRQAEQRRRSERDN